MSTSRKTAQAVLGLSVALLAGSAAAVTLTGSSVTYSFNDAELGLYGTAALTGDDLVFTPVSFQASSANGIPGFAVQTLHVTVTANTGYQLSAFNLTEDGSYFVSGSGTAAVAGNLSALDIEGNTGNSVFDSLATTSPLNVVGTTTNWAGSAAITLPAAGWGGADGVIDSVSLTLSNQLFATSVPGSMAQVWKSTVALNAVTTPVPEAETWAMMLAGLGLVGFVAQRRRATAAC